MWTIHDFPGYGIVSGCQHQGYKACPPCGSNIVSRWSKELGKPIFEGSRRWLQRNHPYRKHPNAKHFDDKEELWRRPRTTTTTETLRRAQRIEDWVVEGNVLGTKGCPSRKTGIRRHLALFDLPYWDVSVKEIYSPNVLCILTSRLTIMWGCKPSCHHHMSCCSMHHSQGQISMSIFAFNHNHIGVELAETIDSTYIRCDAHRKKCM